ncbi:MAG: Ig-like domain-containing protein [Bacteroidales bacterium]|nr:Ig-like domain-containing protein [Bacteroidales bacterium]MCB9000192.1 Ig-like domain-containing protein [Bacteroidales bacterium]
MKNRHFLSVLLVLTIVYSGCAKMGALTGGAKDEDPPVLIKSSPKNYSTNFKGQKIQLDFDEYIALKNVNQELIISPPLPNKPVVRIKNKSILIDLKNELKENTTYTLNFGKAIADNNEGNPLTNFEFVFSTGDFLDSLSIKGSLLNSFDLTASKEPFIVGLYDQFEDSVPYKSIPVYIGKTDSKGFFQINNIKSDSFKIFALHDLNYNLLFDMPTEEIAFSDSLLILTPEFLLTLPERIEKPDTAKINLALKKGNGELKNLSPKDSIATDSSIHKPKLPALYIDMLYFLEDSRKQYMSNNDRLNKESFLFSFNLPLEKDPDIRVLDYDNSKKWCLPEYSEKRDSFIYWLTDTSLISRDTLKLEIIYPATDSLGELYSKTDTIKFITRKAPLKTGKSKEPEAVEKVKLAVSTIRNNSFLDLDKQISFSFNFPLEKIDTSRLHLFSIIDSTEKVREYRIESDSIFLRRTYMLTDWKEKEKFRLEVLPGAFTDIYQHTNDSLQTKFAVQQKSYYGSLTVSLSDVSTPILVQFMDDRGKILQTRSADTDGSIVFDYLKPAKYKLKFIFDVNNNGKWDTGNYLGKTQAERVLFYTGEINVRSNWELEVKQSMK